MKCEKARNLEIRKVGKLENRKLEIRKPRNQEIKSKLAKCSVENQKNQEIKSKLEIKSGNKI